MYLTISQCEKLDQICNRFEVALRSYVSDVITDEMNEQKFVNHLDNISKSYHNSTDYKPIHNNKFKSKAGYLKSQGTYTLLLNSKKSLIAKEIFSADVITVGDLISLIQLFFDPLFIDLSRKFESIENFNELITLYNKIRDILAHPASAKIIKKDLENILFLISGITNQIPDKYFWYCPLNEINLLIINLSNDINRTIPIKNNLYQVPQKYNKLILRERKIEGLFKLICGEYTYSRKSGSVELHGYGGVGKTALALEFCYEIIRKELNGVGYGFNFILWLSLKNEELRYKPITGELTIKNLEPNFEKSDDIILLLKNLIDKQDLSDEQFFNDIYINKIKGLIVLDNLESLEDDEKRKIKGIIKRFPDTVHFILTSRNYEEIGEDALEIQGFPDIREGKLFIQHYCELKSFTPTFEEEKLNSLIKNSCGNTLLLVLSLERIMDGTTSLENILEELKGHKEKEIDLITDFMYKNTFDSAISEIESKGINVDVKKLLTFMLIYKHPIDFHSIREMMDHKDSRELDTVLNGLIRKFIIVKNKGYYELHEFALKFIKTKFLPDQIQLKKYEKIVNDYKISYQEALRKLYEDKANFALIEPILDDWKPETESDIIAIANAYLEYSKIKKELVGINSKPQLVELYEKTKSLFDSFEARSIHPYIKFQKARIFSLFQNNYLFSFIESKSIREEIIKCYDEAYFSIKYRHSYIMKTESYAAFLWKYGINLIEKRDYNTAARILEESIQQFEFVGQLRNKENIVKVNTTLGLVYSKLFLMTGEELYLNKIRIAVNNSNETCIKLNKPYLESKNRNILLLFTDVHLSSFNPAKARDQLQKLGHYSRYYEPLVKSIKEKVNQVV